MYFRQSKRLRYTAELLQNFQNDDLFDSADEHLFDSADVLLAFDILCQHPSTVREVISIYTVI